MRGDGPTRFSKYPKGAGVKRYRGDEDGEASTEAEVQEEILSQGDLES